jgi:transcriptional regulator
MYTPQHFEQHNEVSLFDLIEQYPFATLVTHSNSGIEANHIPLYLQENKDKKLLLGHIAKANPLWKTVQEGAEALIIFNGPNCYISPNYYPSKQENGRVVPTWNYVAVHVKGNIKYFHDDETKLEIVNRLTNIHETNQKVPWTVNDAPSIYIKKMLSAIVGIEIEVMGISGKWKVSQNKSVDNQLGIMSGLLSEADYNPQKLAAIIKTNQLKGIK